MKSGYVSTCKVADAVTAKCRIDEELHCPPVLIGRARLAMLRNVILEETAAKLRHRDHTFLVITFRCGVPPRRFEPQQSQCLASRGVRGPGRSMQWSTSAGDHERAS